ncbi:MAG: hypothetical protein M2R45_03893 [Verrucomicrobia subdivision 3 bacterium]|nr:hypothetical protein [Limisphaerales bacterium]MCS1412596.1 hypothetical protein [Limisphaerales bacterium]
MQRSRDQYTTILAHPFEADLAPGTYQLEGYCGKEHFPYRRGVKEEAIPSISESLYGNGSNSPTEAGIRAKRMCIAVT